MWRGRHESGLAECKACGNPLSECSDDHKTWFPQLAKCNATMTRLAAQKRWESRHDAAPYHDGEFKVWGKERTAKTPFHFNEGVTIWASSIDHGFGGDFLGLESGPAPEGDGEDDGHHDQ